jgi:putative lipoprotein
LKTALLLLSMALLSALPAHAQQPAAAQTASTFGMVTGTVAYRQRIALAPNAVLRVQLENVSLADAAAKIVSEVLLPTNGKQVPLSFAVPYRKADIVTNHRYNIRATILVNGKAQFISTTANSVLTNGAPTNIAIMLQASAPAPPTASTAKLEETYWKLTSLTGQAQLVPIADNQKEAQITLHKQGTKMMGTAGCNRLFGTYKVTSSQLKFTGVGGTMMACPEPLMKQERNFIAALKATTGFRIRGEELELLAGTKVVAKFHSVYLR